MVVETSIAQAYRIAIPEVRPQLDCGRYAIKRIVGERLRVTADIIKEGHDVLAAEVRYRHHGDDGWQAVPMTYSFNEDEWSAEIPLEQIGVTEYTVAAWTDAFASWTQELSRKVEAGRDVASELLEGVQLIRDTARRADGPVTERLEEYAARLEEATPQAEQVRSALSPELDELMARNQPRDDLTTYYRWLPVIIDRERARYGGWYEMFPRSYSSEPGRHGTLREAEERLLAIRQMGFDVVYLPPIHPIGMTNRKGKNNSLVTEDGDPGSPWAIGSEHGGHDAVNPGLGTIEDFDHFVQTARDLGLEIALDFAIQASPDHPYVHEHPQWFRRRPDGTIKYAENPPKRYEDIVALDMWSEEYEPLWQELKRVALHWIDHGVEIFRVDNPHTKPIAFWQWLIAEIRREHPQVLFLAEAFTRPKKMELLAKIGFDQSYSYFTWRNARWELEEYMRYLTQGPVAEYMQPNFFTNTPDILNEYLVVGGRPAFKIRVALASTLSSSYGIYSGYELIENTPVRPGSEEYLDSEKYQIKVRDWNMPGNITGYITRLNEIRRSNRALHLFRNLRFHYPDNPNIMAYSKVSEDGSNRILVVANLDPFNTHEATVFLDGAALGIGNNDWYVVHDLITEARYTWSGTANYVRLDPRDEPVHVFRIEHP